MDKSASRPRSAASALVLLALTVGMTPLQVHEALAQTATDKSKSVSYFVKNSSDWGRFVRAVQRQNEKQAMDIGQKGGLSADEVRAILADVKASGPRTTKGSASPMFW
jgi:hypothetical protein